MEQNREQARALMRKAGYGPEHRLRTKVFTRDLAAFRDPALLLIDQIRSIYIDAELDVVDTGLFYNRVFKKDYSIGLNLTGSSVDDPDQHFFENYACGSLRNYTNYCNPALETLFAKQSMRERSGERTGHRVGDRAQAGRGRGAPDHLPRRGRRVLAALREEPHDHGEQHLQRLALRGCVAGQVSDAAKRR